MKQKVSDYIADHIAEWGIRDVFTVTGGGAMHMPWLQRLMHVWIIGWQQSV